MIARCILNALEKLAHAFYSFAAKAGLGGLEILVFDVFKGLRAAVLVVAPTGRELWQALRKGFWGAYIRVLKVRTLCQTIPKANKVELEGASLGDKITKESSSRTDLLAKSAWANPRLSEFKVACGIIAGAVGPYLSRASFVRSWGLDSLLVLLPSVKGSAPSGLYFKLEHLNTALIKSTPATPSLELGTAGRAVTAAIFTLATFYTLVFSLSLIAAFNLVLVTKQAALGTLRLLATLAKTLTPLALCALSCAKAFCCRTFNPSVRVLNGLLGLGAFVLNCFIISANLFFVRANEGLRGAALNLAASLGMVRPTPAIDSFALRVARRVYRKVWPFYTDELGRSFFRRTALGGALALAGTCASGLKLLLREALEILALLSFTLMVFLLPIDMLSRAHIFYSATAAYAVLRVFIKTKPQALRLGRKLRLLKRRFGRYLYTVWYRRRIAAKVAEIRRRKAERVLRVVFLQPLAFIRGLWLRLKELRLRWATVKTTLKTVLLWRAGMRYSDDHGDWYKLHAIGKDAYPTIENFEMEYRWWAKEWPDFMAHCKRTAPHKPLPIEKVVYRNWRNLRKNAWSETLVVWLPYDDWQSPVCPITYLGALSELSEDYALYREVKLKDPYPIGIFGWTPKYMEMRFEAKLFEINNWLLAEWDEFQSEFDNDFEYEVVGYLISRRIRFEDWKSSLKPRSRLLPPNLFRYAPYFSVSSNLFLYEPTVVTRYFFLNWWRTEETLQTEWTPLLRVGTLPCLPYSHLGWGGLFRVLAKNFLWRSNFYRATLNRAVSLFFKPYVVVGGFAYSTVPYNPYRNLKRRLARVVSLGLDWPNYSSKSSKASYHNAIDLPLIEANNLQTFVDLNFPIPRATWDTACRYYRRAVFFSLSLVYFFLALSLSWFFLYPPKGLHGLLSICKTPKHYLGGGAATRWAVNTLGQKRWAEKSTLWVWSFGALGFARGYVYFTGSFINLPGRPLVFVPRWSFPFKGRYQRYNDPYLLSWSKAKLAWPLIKDSIFRSPYSAAKHNKRCGISYVGNGPRWVTSLYRPYTPFHPFDRTPMRAVIATLPAQGWKHVCRGQFLRLCSLWPNQRIPHIAYAAKYYVAKPFFLFSKAFYTVYHPRFFDTKRLVSYFLWKNTHPCNNIMVTWTHWLKPPHWGGLRPSISALHLLKHTLKLLRFALIGYRFKTFALPLLKAHLWLHYFYPLATIMGVYPSFIEPKAIILDMGGVAAFLRLSYRLLRLAKTSIGPSFAYNSHNHVALSNDSITEASHLTLNSAPSMGIMDNGASDLNYGFGGHWGFDQTNNLIGKLNNIRPYLQTLEAPNAYNYPDHLPAFYRVVYPHPTAPLAPPLEKPVNVLFDKIFPRTNEHFEAMRAVSPDLHNLSCENTPTFYKGFKALTSNTCPSKWEGGFANDQSEVGSSLFLNRGQSYAQQVATVRQDLNRRSRSPSPDLHGGVDTLDTKVSSIFDNGGTSGLGHLWRGLNSQRPATSLKAPDDHLSLWEAGLRLPFEAERFLAATKGGPESWPLATEIIPARYPLSLENFKNNHRRLTTITFKRRTSCNHYRHILEPSDLKLRKVPDSSDPNFNLAKEPDFINLFNQPIDDHLETWGFLYKHVIIRNKVAWDWGLDFPYHWNYGLSHAYWWWFRDVFADGWWIRDVFAKAKIRKGAHLPDDTKILEDPKSFYHPLDFAEALSNTFGTDIAYRAEALRPINLKYVTSPVQTYGRIKTHTVLPYSFSKPSALCNEPTEMNFFHKLRPFSLNCPRTIDPYRTWLKPLPKKVTKIFDRPDLFPSNGFLLKVQKRQGTAIHHEAHPGLRSYWAKDGVNARSLPLDGTLHSRHCIPPTHSNHELKGFILDLANLAQTWGGGLGKMLNETFYSWMFGWESIGVVSRLLCAPSKLACAVKWKITTEPRLDLLPNLRFKLKGVRFWDFIDFIISNNYHLIVPLMWFTVRVAFKCRRWDRWWEAQPNPVDTMFRFGWGGIDKVGDFILYGPFFTPLLLAIKAYPGFMEPFSKAHWEVRPKYRHPIDFRKRIRWWKCWIPQKITWTIPAIWPLETYLKSLPVPFTGDALRLGKHRWWKLRDVSRWDGICLTQRPGLTLDRAKTNYHFKVVPVWLLEILFPTIQWGWYRLYHNTCHHSWWKLRPQFSFWTRGRTSYEDVFGHTCVKGDFQVWKWYPSKPFGGTPLLFFGHGWPSYGPTEYPHKNLRYYLRSNDSSTPFIDPTLTGRDEISAGAQNWKTFKAFFIYLRSPVTFLRYHIMKKFLLLKEGHLMWPLYDKLFTFVYTVSPILSLLWRPWFPNWGQFILPQPPTPQFPLAVNVPEPFYLTHLPFSWWKVITYVVPFYRSSYFVFFDRKRPAAYDWVEKGRTFEQGYYAESIVAEDSIYLFWPDPDAILDYYWRPERGWHPHVYAIASNDSMAWNASN